MEILIVDRKAELQEIVRLYVYEGIAKGNLDAIPYHEGIKLRDPLSSGGTASPLKDKNKAYEAWWKALPGLLEKCELIDSHIDENQMSVTVEFYCYIRQPKVKLRLMDRFLIDEEGKIFAQENLIYGITPNFNSNICID